MSTPQTLAAVDVVPSEYGNQL